MKLTLEMTVSFCSEHKNTFEDYSFDTLGGLNWDRLTLSLSVKIDISDLKKKSSCFSTSLLFCRIICILVLNICLFFLTVLLGFRKALYFRKMQR